MVAPLPWAHLLPLMEPLLSPVLRLPFSLPLPDPVFLWHQKAAGSVMLWCVGGRGGGAQRTGLIIRRRAEQARIRARHALVAIVCAVFISIVPVAIPIAVAGQQQARISGTRRHQQQQQQRARGAGVGHAGSLRCGGMCGGRCKYAHMTVFLSPALPAAAWRTGGGQQGGACHRWHASACGPPARMGGPVATGQAGHCAAVRPTSRTAPSHVHLCVCIDASVACGSAWFMPPTQCPISKFEVAPASQACPPPIQRIGGATGASKITIKNVYGCTHLICGLSAALFTRTRAEQLTVLSMLVLQNRKQTSS